MNLWKRLPLNEKYCHPTMKGLVGSFRVSLGVQESYVGY